MEIQTRLSFVVPRPRLLSLYADPDYYCDKYAGLGAWDLKTLEALCGGQRFRIRHRYRIRAELPLPGFARRLAGESSVVTQEQVWDLKTGRGRLQVQVQGVPLEIGATMQVHGDAGGCSSESLWTLRCALPLIGGAVERLVAGDIRRKAARDQQVTDALLARGALHP